MKPSRPQLAQAIADITKAGKITPTQTRSVAAYLMATKQADQLAPLLRDVARVWASQGRLEVQVVSARPLSRAVLQDIRSQAKKLYPHATRISIAATIDQSLIGGARITIGEYLLDMSVRERLAHFTSLALLEDA